MSTLMTNFDWKGYAKDLQESNSFMKAQIDKLAGWIIGLGLVSIGLVILVITIWSK